MFKAFSYFFKEKTYIPKNNEVLLNKKLFLQYNEGLMRVLEDLYHTEDQEALTLGELKHLLRKNVKFDNKFRTSTTLL